MKLLALQIFAAEAAFSTLPKVGQKQFTLDNVSYNPQRDVPELMSSMNFTNWERDDYFNLYDQLLQALDPDFEVPQTALMGDLSAPWSQNFQAIRLKSAQKEPEPEISPEDRDFMMRYMQLKYSILFLQQYRYLGKYCFYGCWCLPGGVGDIGAGHGQPVDNIDRACREYSTCYQCMYNQQMGGECDDTDQERRSKNGLF